MKLKPTTKHRQNFLISFFNIFCIIINYTNVQLVKQHYNQLTGSVTQNVANLSFASERMQSSWARSQLRSRLLSSNDFNRRRGVAMSINVSISAVQTHTPDVDADEMSNSRRSPSLISVSVGVYQEVHPCCRKQHGSIRNFSLTGTIF